MRYAVESVAAGFIGLDFKNDPGNLDNVARNSLATSERDYWEFANRMVPGDPVLIIVHHFPFALVFVDDVYNYITHPEPELSVWFRHFRRIAREKTRYFADYRTNASGWDQFKMTDTISILTNEDGKRIQLMKEWIGSIGEPAV
jgi:hypothetical protein